MFVLLNKFMVPCHLIPAIFGRSYSIQSITFMHLTNFAIAKNPKSAYKTFGTENIWIPLVLKKKLFAKLVLVKNQQLSMSKF